MTTQTVSTTQAADFYRAETYDPQDSIGYLMKRGVVSMVYQADKHLEQHELTSAQWGPIMHLGKAGKTTVAELARLMLVDAGAMTRLLDRLEKKGLCKRLRCSEDRRVVRVELTPDGHTALKFVPVVLADVMNAHLQGFSESEWQVLKGYLRRILANGEALRNAA